MPGQYSVGSNLDTERIKDMCATKANLSEALSDAVEWLNDHQPRLTQQQLNQLVQPPQIEGVWTLADQISIPSHDGPGGMGSLPSNPRSYHPGAASTLNSYSPGAASNPSSCSCIPGAACVLYRMESCPHCLYMRLQRMTPSRSIQSMIAKQDDAKDELHRQFPAIPTSSGRYKLAPRQSRPPSGESRYIQGIINPPQTIVDLLSLINGDYTQLDDVIASIRNDEAVKRSLPGDVLHDPGPGQYAQATVRNAHTLYAGDLYRSPGLLEADGHHSWPSGYHFQPRCQAATANRTQTTIASIYLVKIPTYQDLRAGGRPRRDAPPRAQELSNLDEQIDAEDDVRVLTAISHAWLLLTTCLSTWPSTWPSHQPAKLSTWPSPSSRLSRLN
ncbi:hypothetical protein BJ170DRAFT_737126 [Xylariales sp. AK1849]|nr:hypothetical protein BJ170DRAFT_737126 [Xylariales sp. AK1849]